MAQLTHGPWMLYQFVSHRKLLEVEVITVAYTLILT